MFLIFESSKLFTTQLYFSVKYSSATFWLLYLSSMRITYPELESPREQIWNIQDINMIILIFDWYDCAWLVCLYFVVIDLILIPQYQPSPPKWFLPLSDLESSCSSLRAWEIVRNIVWKNDWIIVLPVFIVTSCEWLWDPEPVHGRHIKHSGQ